MASDEDLDSAAPVVLGFSESVFSADCLETLEEIQSNIDYAIDKYEKYGVYPTFSIANPLPVAAVVFPRESRASVLSLTSGSKPACSAIPPALSATGP